MYSNFDCFNSGVQNFKILCVQIWPERAKTFPGPWLVHWSLTYAIVWPPTVFVQHRLEPKCYLTNPKNKILVVHEVLQIIIIEHDGFRIFINNYGAFYNVIIFFIAFFPVEKIKP